MKDKDKFLLMVHRYLDGGAQEDSLVELTRLLDTDEEARSLFFREMRLHAALATKFKGLDLPAASRGRGHRLWLRAAWPLAIAAAFAAIVGGSLFFVNQGRERALSARITSIQGPADLVRGSTAILPQVGEGVGPGDRLETGRDGKVCLVYPDSTKLELGGDARLTLTAGSKAKRLRLDAGRMQAEVARQPAGCPMVFSVPRAEATVLGTKLVLAVVTNAARLDVAEGLVRFARQDASSSWEVSSGGYLLAGPETTLSANARRSGQEESLRIIEDHEGPLAWKQLPECATLAFGLSPVAKSGRNGLRIVYEPKPGDRWTYGEIVHPFTLKPGDRILRFSINVERYEGNANWTIQFRQRDLNCWMIATGLFADLVKGWNEVEVEIPRTPENAWGGGTYRPNEVQDLLFAVCIRAATFTMDDFAVGGGESRQ